MRRIIAVLVLVVIMILYGCGQSTTIDCKSPLTAINERCCLDEDSNSVCDVDEKPVIEARPKQNATTEPTPVVNETKTEEKPATTEKPAETALNTAEEAEKAGKIFAEKWQMKQYSIMYAMFTPTLKQKKTADEFKTIMELEPLYKRLTKVEFKGIKLIDADSAELNLMIHTNIQDIDVPGATMEYIDGSWRVNAFVDVFEMQTYDAACSGYRNNNDYDMEDCAFDFAKKLRLADYCNMSGCHYVACLKVLGKPSGMMQEAEQCYMCQPVGKTTVECILDIAIKYDKIAACNVIKEDRYSDRYCKCYGGFAKAKGTIGYCNTIQDENYKEFCIKEYDGEYC
jgi:hypothetical protein